VVTNLFEVTDYIVFRCEAFECRFEHKGIYNSAL